MDYANDAEWKAAPSSPRRIRPLADRRTPKRAGRAKPSPFPRFAVSAPAYPCYPRYPWSRVALNVPCFDGRSPMSGANSTSPVIKLGVSNSRCGPKKILTEGNKENKDFLNANSITKLRHPRFLLFDLHRARSFGKCRSSERAHGS